MIHCGIVKRKGIDTECMGFNDNQIHMYRDPGEKIKSKRFIRFINITLKVTATSLVDIKK
jgi:hypothetical protein